MILTRVAAFSALALVLAACSSAHHSSSTASRPAVSAAGSGSPTSGTGSPTSGAGSGAASIVGGPSSGSSVRPSAGANASSPTSLRGGTSAGGGVPGSGALQPGHAGSYRYVVTGAFAGQPVPPAATLTVSTAVGGTQTFTLVNTDSSGGSTLGERLSFRSDGVYLLSLTITSTASGYPPYSETLVPTSGAVRIVGSSEAPASTTFAVASDDAHATVTAHVLGTTSASVGGSSLRALHLTFTSTDLAGTIHSGLLSANYTGSFAVDALLSPATLLPYRQKTSFTLAVKLPKLTVSSNTTATLQSTTPN